MANVPLSDHPSLASEGNTQQAPTKAVSPGFQLLLSLANMVVWLTIVPLQSVLLPAQFAYLDPQHATGSFSLASSFSGIAALIAQPLSGALSDVTSSRLGPRRTWLIGGTLVTFAVLLLMANASNVVSLIVEFTVFGIAVNSVLSPLFAIIPDRVPVSQRATVSAFVGLAQPVGTLLGIFLFAYVVQSIPATYYTFAVSLLAGIALLVVFVREPALPKAGVQSFSLSAFVRDFFKPVRYADYRWVWATRFCVITAQLLVASFLFFYLQVVIRYNVIFPGQTLIQGVLWYQVLSTACIVVSSIISGMISDRLQKRKLFVVVACALMFVALLLLTFVPTWTSVLCVGAIFGIGFGIFVSSDVALASQVLPEANARGKDMGLFLAAGTLPLIFFPVITGIALGQFHSYAVLFGIGAVATALGALCILPVRSVR